MDLSQFLQWEVIQKTCQDTSTDSEGIGMNICVYELVSKQ